MRFWYSGLARIASRVLASGAWRRMRSSQLCFVSSIAAHSSPRGSTPAAANAVGRHPGLDVAEPLDAEGVGEPLGRVDGEDEHLAAEVGRRHRRRRRRRRRLADAARAAVDDDLLGRERAARAWPSRGRSCVLASRHQNPSSCAEGLGDLAGGADAVVLREQLGHVEQLDAVGQALAQPGEVLGPRAPQA